MALSAIGENPANAGVTRLCGVSPCPVPDIATALPNVAPYQLGYTRIFNFCHYTTAREKIKDFSVCGHSCGQCRFCAVFGNWWKSRKRRRRKALRRFASPYPGYRHGTPKAGALPAALHPDMYFSARQHAFAHTLKRNGAFCRTRFPRSRSAAACVFRLHRRQTCTFFNLRKIKFNTFFRNSQRFSALQFRVGCGMLYK